MSNDVSSLLIYSKNTFLSAYCVAGPFLSSWVKSANRTKLLLLWVPSLAPILLIFVTWVCVHAPNMHSFSQQALGICLCLLWGGELAGVAEKDSVLRIQVKGEGRLLTPGFWHQGGIYENQWWVRQSHLRVTPELSLVG